MAFQTYLQFKCKNAVQMQIQPVGVAASLAVY